MSLIDAYPVRRAVFALTRQLPTILLGEEALERRNFRIALGYKPDFDHPTTLNEKMCWLKLHDHRDFCTMVADKYRVRDYIRENFGDEHLVPLVTKLDSWRDVRREVFPDYPSIIKCNSGSNTWQIVRDPDTVDYEQLRKDCRVWMNFNHYYNTGEWQYKNIKPCLLIEKLLMMDDGKIPSDVKLHFFNGKCAFIYKVIDREGDSQRALFSPEWELLPYQFVSNGKYKPITKPIHEERPQCLDEMIEMGTKIAENFKYVRVDFYDMGDKFYFSEITLYHGAGHSAFHPEEYADRYAEMLQL